MQFVYGAFAGEQSVEIETKEYPHLFKVRRISSGINLKCRNLQDKMLYTYEVSSIDKRKATLLLKDAKKWEIEPQKYLHIGWCVVDPKTIEKNLPMINEMGVSKLTLVYADFSQKNFRVDLKRLERILINSSQQCGRSSLMKIEVLNSVLEYTKLYPKSAIIDFCDTSLSDLSEEKEFLIGPEGGFSQDERILLEKQKRYGFQSPTILRSESAVIGVCAKLLL